MGLFDKAKQAAEQARAAAARVAAERGDVIRGGLDKAGRTVDQRTGGKYHDAIRKAAGAADARLSGLAAEHAAATRDDPVSAEARVVDDQDVVAEGLRPPGTDPGVVRGRGSRLYGGTAPGGVSPEAPTPEGETPGGPAPGSSR